MPYLLSEALDEMEKALMDTGNAYWSTAQLTRALRQALHLFNSYSPRRAVADVTLTAGSREATLSLAGLMAVVNVWYPYTSTDPEYPPNVASWRMLTDTVLYLDAADLPETGDKARVFYLAQHTIQNLDSATGTTLSAVQEEIVLALAAGHACEQRAADAIGEINVSDWTPIHWMNEGQRRIANALAQLGALDRQGQRGDSYPRSWPLDKWDSSDRYGAEYHIVNR